jgi:predicted lactoylglutathione lyase
MEFFRKLGYSFNPQFTDDKAACLVISEDIYSMLLKEEFFKTFTSKQICDTSKSTEVMIALSTDSKQAVDKMVDTALKSGGSPANETQDLGFMYSRSFQDPDEHIWEVLWMDPAHVQSSEQVKQN